MTLGRAVLVSMALHLCLGAAAASLGSLLGERPAPMTPGESEADPELFLNLVDPASAALGPEDIAPTGAEATRRGAGSRGGVPGRSADGEATTGPAGNTATDEENAAPESAEDGALVAATTDSGGRSARRPPVVPGRLSPRELAELVGLEAEGLDDQLLQGMFSAMHKYALQSPRPAASTYRQLLRAWIDGLMGFPYPVTEDLARNVDMRFIGGIRIEVDGDGRLRLDDLWIYPGVLDPDQRLAGYYRRVVIDATAYPFLPPGDARLPAPHSLEYRIVNPRARR